MNDATCRRRQQYYLRLLNHHVCTLRSNAIEARDNQVLICILASINISTTDWCGFLGSFELASLLDTRGTMFIYFSFPE
jgi:hypothetical protein